MSGLPEHSVILWDVNNPTAAVGYLFFVEPRSGRPTSPEPAWTFGSPHMRDFAKAGLIQYVGLASAFDGLPLMPDGAQVWRPTAADQPAIVEGRR